MNFLAAFLLIHMEEESAFWTLVCIVEKFLKGYFTENMKGSWLSSIQSDLGADAMWV